MEASGEILQKPCRADPSHWKVSQPYKAFADHCTTDTKGHASFRTGSHAQSSADLLGLQVDKEEAVAKDLHTSFVFQRRGQRKSSLLPRRL